MPYRCNCEGDGIWTPLTCDCYESPFGEHPTYEGCKTSGLGCGNQERGGGGRSGACCFGWTIDGNSFGTDCLQTSEEAGGLSIDDCSFFGGTYQGDDTNCDSVNCDGGGGEQQWYCAWDGNPMLGGNCLRADENTDWFITKYNSKEECEAPSFEWPAGCGRLTGGTGTGGGGGSCPALPRAFIAESEWAPKESACHSACAVTSLWEFETVPTSGDSQPNWEVSNAGSTVKYTAVDSQEYGGKGTEIQAGKAARMFQAEEDFTLTVRMLTNHESRITHDTAEFKIYEIAACCTGVCDPIVVEPETCCTRANDSKQPDPNGDKVGKFWRWPGRDGLYNCPCGYAQTDPFEKNLLPMIPQLLFTKGESEKKCGEFMAEQCSTNAGLWPNHCPAWNECMIQGGRWRCNPNSLAEGGCTCECVQEKCYPTEAYEMCDSFSDCDGCFDDCGCGCKQLPNGKWVEFQKYENEEGDCVFGFAPVDPENAPDGCSECRNWEASGYVDLLGCLNDHCEDNSDCCWGYDDEADCLCKKCGDEDYCKGACCDCGETGETTESACDAFWYFEGWECPVYNDPSQPELGLLVPASKLQFKMCQNHSLYTKGDILSAKGVLVNMGNSTSCVGSSHEHPDPEIREITKEECDCGGPEWLNSIDDLAVRDDNTVHLFPGCDLNLGGLRTGTLCDQSILSGPVKCWECCPEGSSNNEGCSYESVTTPEAGRTMREYGGPYVKASNATEALIQCCSVFPNSDCCDVDHVVESVSGGPDPADTGANCVVSYTLEDLEGGGAPKLCDNKDPITLIDTDCPYWSPRLPTMGMDEQTLVGYPVGTTPCDDSGATTKCLDDDAVDCENDVIKKVCEERPLSNVGEDDCYCVPVDGGRWMLAAAVDHPFAGSYLSKGECESMECGGGGNGFWKWLGEDTECQDKDGELVCPYDPKGACCEEKGLQDGPCSPCTKTPPDFTHPEGSGRVQLNMTGCDGACSHTMWDNVATVTYRPATNEEIAWASSHFPETCSSGYLIPVINGQDWWHHPDAEWLGVTEGSGPMCVTSVTDNPETVCVSECSETKLTDCQGDRKVWHGENTTCDTGGNWIDTSGTVTPCECGEGGACCYEDIVITPPGECWDCIYDCPETPATGSETEWWCRDAGTSLIFGETVCDEFAAGSIQEQGHEYMYLGGPYPSEDHCVEGCRLVLDGCCPSPTAPHEGMWTAGRTDWCCGANCGESCAKSVVWFNDTAYECTSSQIANDEVYRNWDPGREWGWAKCGTTRENYDENCGGGSPAAFSSDVSFGDDGIARCGCCYFPSDWDGDPANSQCTIETREDCMYMVNATYLGDYVPCTEESGTPRCGNTAGPPACWPDDCVGKNCCFKATWVEWTGGVSVWEGYKPNDDLASGGYTPITRDDGWPSEGWTCQTEVDYICHGCRGKAWNTEEECIQECCTIPPMPTDPDPDPPVSSYPCVPGQETYSRRISGASGDCPAVDGPLSAALLDVRACEETGSVGTASRETVCGEKSEEECTELNGEYKGDGTECEEDTCPPTVGPQGPQGPQGPPQGPQGPQGPPQGTKGACCVEQLWPRPNYCSDISEEECLAGNGTYKGDGTQCGTALPGNVFEICTEPGEPRCCVAEDDYTGGSVVKVRTCVTNGGDEEVYPGHTYVCIPQVLLMGIQAAAGHGFATYENIGSYNFHHRYIKAKGCSGLGGERVFQIPSGAVELVYDEDADYYWTSTCWDGQSALPVGEDGGFGNCNQCSAATPPRGWPAAVWQPNGYCGEVGRSSRARCQQGGQTDRVGASFNNY